MDLRQPLPQPSKPLEGIGVSRKEVQLEDLKVDLYNISYPCHKEQRGWYTCIDITFDILVPQ